MNKREAERISDAADALVMDDVKPKRTAKSAIKAPVKVATKSTAKKTNAKALVMDGMVRQKGATKTVDTRGDLDAEADGWKLEAKKIIEKKTGGKSASNGRAEDSAGALDESKKMVKKRLGNSFQSRRRRLLRLWWRFWWGWLVRR